MAPTQKKGKAYLGMFVGAEASAKTRASTLDFLFGLATDCLRLSMHFFYPIQQCAQQVYHTAVPLLPVSSPLRKSCLQTVVENQLSQITGFSGAPDTWGLLLRTINTRPRQLTCIATSAQMIIAACDNIVNIYDPITFVLQQSLDVSERVTKIQTSPDGSTLFFVHSLSVTMWDVQTGGLITTFTMQSGINDIAVSETYIACGMADGSVIFWNIHTKEEGETFGNNQPIVSICWFSPRELAVATQNSLYIHEIVIGETIGRFSVPGHVWGMVYLEDENKFLIGASNPNPRVDSKTSYFFIRCQQPKLQPHELKAFCWKFTNIKQSSEYSGQLSRPTLVGKEIACITLGNGVQSFHTGSLSWTNNPPLLGAATSVAASFNGNLVVQTKDSIQIFSFDVLTSGKGKAHSEMGSSRIYPLGKKHIVCLQPTRHITLLELETLRGIHSNKHTQPLMTSLMDRLASAPASSSYGLVTEFGISAVMQAWELGTPLPELPEAVEEDILLSGWSPECNRVATVRNSPWRVLRVKDAKTATVLASLPLGDDGPGMGEVYDVTFDSESRLHLKVDGPGGLVQIPCDIIASPSGANSHTIIRGEPVPLSEPREIPPYRLDGNYEWVLDAKSRKVCWISPGDIRRGNGGHFWSGLSLVMLGDDDVVRKLTFKHPDC